MNCGIYIIKNIVNNKVYIGSSQDIKRRFYLHKHYLKKNSHINLHLQTAWNFYGEKSFVFEILEIISDKTLLSEKEMHYIQLYCSTNRENGYNICEDTNAPMRNRKHSIESIEKMKKSKIGKNNSFYGKTHSDETKLKISNSKKGKKLPEELKNKIVSKSCFQNGEHHLKAKLTFEIAKLIRKQFDETENKVEFTNQMASKYNVSYSTIRRILNNKSYKEEKNEN
jgi:group I intron endonuclease